MSSTTATTSPPGDDGAAREPDAWIPEPLAPGALGTNPAEHAGGGLFTDLPPLPLTGALADALTAARTGLDEAATASCYLSDLGAPQRLQALQELAQARHVTDAALTRLTASFTPEEVRTLGSTDLVDLLMRHTGACPARAKTEKVLAAALTVEARALPEGFLPHDTNDTNDTNDVGDVDTEPDTEPDVEAESGGDVPFDLDDTTAGENPGAATSAVALGRLGAAHAAGRVSTDIAALATRTVASLPAALRRTHGGAADHLLARLLPGLTHDQARTVCAALAFELDPERAERGLDPDDLERRYLDLTVHDDGWGTIRGQLDPETTAELKAFLDARSKPAATVTAPVAPDQLDQLDLDQSDSQAGQGHSQSAAASPHGDGAESAPEEAADAGAVSVKDTRRPGQRRHDALAEGIRTARAEAGTRGGEPVRVIVTTTDDQLAGVPGAGQATCETTGRHLSSAQLARVACAGVLQAVRLSCAGADAEVLSLGRSVRLFTAAQRRAMLARDGGCVIPGCSAPPAMLEAHHVVEWQRGGATDVDSGVLMCTRHHVLVTVGVWEVAVVAGVPQVRPPRSVDPLRRWVRNPRRSLADAVHRAADRVVGQMLLEPPQGWVDGPEPPDPVPDIPSPRGTCDC